MVSLDNVINLWSPTEINLTNALINSNYIIGPIYSEIYLQVLHDTVAVNKNTKYKYHKAIHDDLSYQEESMINFERHGLTIWIF